jgi:hypothetical protein
MNSEAITMDSKIVGNNTIVCNEMDGETVMMSIDLGEFYGINVIGTKIWNLLKAPIKVSEICNNLQSDYNVTQEQCEKDVLFFLNRMAEKAVVTIVKD